MTPPNSEAKHDTHLPGILPDSTEVRHADSRFESVRDSSHVEDKGLKRLYTIQWLRVVGEREMRLVCKLPPHKAPL